MLLETTLEQKCPVLAHVKGKGVVIPGLLQLQGLGKASVSWLKALAWVSSNPRPLTVT